MIPKVYKEFLSFLLEATEDGHIKWEPSSYASGYETVYSDKRFKTWSGYDDEISQHYISFAVEDISGNLIDNFYCNQEDSDYRLLQNIHSSAQRSSNGVNLFIGDILSKMKRDFR